MNKIEQVIRSIVEGAVEKRRKAVVKLIRKELKAIERMVGKRRRGRDAAKEKATAPEKEAQPDRWAPKLIAALRTRMGLNKAKFAKLVGVSARSLMLWEKGKVTPGDENRARLEKLGAAGSEEKAPAKKASKVTPKVIEARRVQGQYLGYLRQVPADEKERFRKLAREKGVPAAVEELKKRLGKQQ